MSLRLIGGWVVVTVLCSAATGALPTTAADDEDKPCTAPEYRQLDFWIGEWDVVNRARPDADRPPARSRITADHGGCVIQEEYHAPTGYSGTSVTFYDAQAGQWHQTWIDNRGSPTYYDGAWKDGALVFLDRDLRYRMTFRPLEDNSVRQLLEISPDRGQTWRVVFDGLYTRRD